METQQPALPSEPIIPPATHKPEVKNSLVLIMSILLIIAVAIAGLFYFQIQKLSKELSKYQIQPSPTPTATTNPTANWKTYTNTQYKYSVKYPADYSVIETSSDYVRFFPGINNPNLPQSQTYLSIQLDKSPQQLPEAVYKKTADGKTLRILQTLMDVDETQKSQIKTIFDQILSTFQFTEATSSAKPTPTSKACTLEAKLCPDGSSVGRTGPNCEFAPCP